MPKRQRGYLLPLAIVLALLSVGSGPATQEENFSKWGEETTELLSQFQEGPSKSLQDFQKETAFLKDNPDKESQVVEPLLTEVIRQTEEATGAFEEGKAQLEAYKYKEANARLRESARGYEFALKSLPALNQNGPGSANSSLAVMVCYNMGHVYTRLMEWDRAEETLLKAMEVQRLSGKEKDLATIYNSLGIVALKKGNRGVVIPYFEECVSLARRADFPQVEGAALGNLGVVYYLKGDPKRALQSYEAAIKIQRKLGHRSWEAKYIASQGLIYQLQGKLEQALHTYNMALRINREIGNKREEAGNLGNMGIIYNFQKKMEEALNAYGFALQIHRELGLRNEAAKDLGNIGIVYQSQGRLEDALSAYEESLRVHKILGNLRGEAKDRNNIAVIYQAQAKTAEALTNYEEAYNLFLFLKSPLETEVIKENIAKLKAQLGEKK